MKFELNRAGVEEVCQSGDVIRYVGNVADQVKGAVEGNSPHGTGHFQESIRVLPPKRTADGIEQTIDSDDFAAHLVEFGSQNNPAYAPFRKAASSLGLKLRGGGERK